LAFRAHSPSLIVEGVDGATWLHHLAAGDYSPCALKAIKNSDLAKDLAAFEQDRRFYTRGSRAQVKVAIKRRYTTLASEPPSLAPAR